MAADVASCPAFAQVTSVRFSHGTPENHEQVNAWAEGGAVGIATGGDAATNARFQPQSTRNDAFTYPTASPPSVLDDFQGRVACLVAATDDSQSAIAACIGSTTRGENCGPSSPSPYVPPASPPASPPPASPTGVCGDGTVLDASSRMCEVVLGNATEVLDGKVEVVLGSATEVIDGKCELIGLGDFDGDGYFRLNDAVFVAKVWTRNEQWPVAGERRDRRSLESTSGTSDGVDLLALLERKDAELERKDAELTELRAKVKDLEAKKFKE